MPTRTDLAAVSIVSALAIGTVPAVLAHTTVEAESWDEAISKLECKDIGKNADGSFSVIGVVKVKGEEHHNPIVNVATYKSEIEAKRC